jgi:hypothetical protein
MRKPAAAKPVNVRTRRFWCAGIVTPLGLPEGERRPFADYGKIGLPGGSSLDCKPLLGAFTWHQTAVLVRMAKEG